jgi:hypothetical protein
MPCDEKRMAVLIPSGIKTEIYPPKTPRKDKARLTRLLVGTWGTHPFPKSPCDLKVRWAGRERQRHTDSTRFMIRYGVVGFGLHAVRRLMPGFALASNSRVTALLRRDLKQAEASAAEYKIPHAFDSAAALLPLSGGCRRFRGDAQLLALERRSASD